MADNVTKSAIKRGKVVLILFVFDTLGKILYEAGYHLSARENQMKVSEKSLNSFALQTHLTDKCVCKLKKEVR